MRIVLLTQHFPPEPFPRPADLARWLLNSGHQVTVVTGYPYYPGGQLYAGTGMRLWEREVIESVDVIRLPLYPGHSSLAIGRVLNYGSFALASSTLGALLTGPFDAIYVEHASTTLGLAGWLLSWLRRARFVYMVDDIWPDVVQAAGFVRHSLLINAIERVERFLYARAAAVTVISQGNRDRLLAKGVAPDKVHFVPHYANESVLYPVEPAPALRDALAITGKFSVMFAGQLGVAQALDTVLAAAAQIRDLADVVFLIVGDGPELKRLQQIAGARGLHNVKFTGRQPAEAMRDLFAVADALLVHLRDSEAFRSTIPSKTVAYMACGRPIIMAVPGDASDYIRSIGAGVACRSEDPEDLANTVRWLYAMTPAMRAAMGQAGRNAFLSLHTRETVFGRIEALLVGRQQRSPDMEVQPASTVSMIGPREAQLPRPATSRRYRNNASPSDKSCPL